MRASMTGGRLAAAALAAALSAHAVPALAQGAARSAEAVIHQAAVEAAAAIAPKAEAATSAPAAAPAADPVKDAGKDIPDDPAAGTSGAPPVSDFKEPPKEEPATPAPAPAAAAPADPLGLALQARLSETKPLVARFPVKQREALQAFYAARSFKPVWIADGRYTPAAKSVMQRLRLAAEDGLEPGAYAVAASPGQSDPEQAEAELKLSSAAVLYARDARGGRLNPAEISKLVTPALDLPSADALLAALAEAGESAGARLQGYNPQNAGYLALKARLASLRGPVVAPEPEGKSVRIPVGPVLKVGMSDPRVPLLRSYFNLPERAAGTLDAAPGEPNDYDRQVSEAVAGFQRRHGLPDNGQLTRSTIVALATAALPPAQGRGTGDESDLLVNMERWRWLPGHLGADYVFVNVPEYRLRVYRGGMVRDETRVIVGKTESPTPLFSGMMEYAVVNPSWFVPPSILKTMLASGRTGGFEVVRRGGQISLRQPPGEKNALGFIKFLFPNQHAVYLHDTPNRSLFSSAKRAMSHGCVRVDDPFRFADAVLPEEWTEARLKKLIGKGERTIHLAAKLPVHLAYLTAYVDDDGLYRTLPDLYGYDRRMKAMLGLSQDSGLVASRPVEPKRQVAAMPSVAAVPAPRRIAPKPVVRQAQRYRRPTPGEFGEPGLWTPEQQPAQPRGLWW